jgi:uncharacterized membrane protein HdeD (DUF308 family)
MLLLYAATWWSMILRGIAAIAFGILAFLWPGITLTALVFLWGAYALVDGVVAIAAGVKSHGEYKRWWLLLLEGLLSIVAGILAFALPGITALLLLVLIAVWAIVTGFFEIAAAIQLRKQIRGEWFLVLAGVCSILFGVLMLVNPFAGALAVVWLIGAYAVVFGALLVALGVRLHGLVKSQSPDRMSPRPV